MPYSYCRLDMYRKAIAVILYFPAMQALQFNNPACLQQFYVITRHVFFFFQTRTVCFALAIFCLLMFSSRKNGLQSWYENESNPKKILEDYVHCVSACELCVKLDSGFVQYLNTCTGLDVYMYFWFVCKKKIIHHCYTSWRW